MISTFTHRFVELLIRLRWLLLAIAAGLVAAAIWPAGQVEFDRSVENMFAADDPLLVPYRKLKRTFGGNELVLAVYEDPELLNPDRSGIHRLAGIAERCEQVPGVRAVLSLDKPMGEAVVDPDHDLALGTRRLFEKYTHGADGETVAVVCMLESESEAPVPRRETIEALRAIMNDLPDGLPSGMLAGEPVLIADGFRYLEQDGRRLGIWSTILLGAIILISFRSVRWVLISLAVVQFALLLTKAIMVWGQLRLTMVSSMLTALITVIGVATVVHIIVRYREATAAGLSPRGAFKRSLTWCAAPVCWACLTDAVGFGSLLFARVGPVQDFGLMMTVGSLVVLVGVFLVVPGLALAGARESEPARAAHATRTGRALQGFLHAVRRRPALFGLSALTVSALAMAGAFRLQVETDFTKNFRAGSPVVQSYEHIEVRLSGAGVFDVILPAPASLNWDYLRRVQKLERRLRAEVAATDGTPALTKVLSLSDAVVRLENVKLPLVRAGLLRAALDGMKMRMPEFTDALYSEDPDHAGQYLLRVMLRARERQPAESKREIIESVQRISAEEFPERPDRPAAQVTGFFVLLTHLVESILRDQWLTFGLASAGIGLMLLLAFRNFSQALVALVPNGFPILMIMGILGWLNIPINMGAAMIAAVSMGLSIDSSVHYIISFQRGLHSGKSVDEALDDVQQSVGQAVVLSTLALIVGFSVLCSSQFVPTIYFGILMSFAMFGGLVGNLLVLPLLLRLTTRGKA